MTLTTTPTREIVALVRENDEALNAIRAPACLDSRVCYLLRVMRTHAIELAARLEAAEAVAPEWTPIDEAAKLLPEVIYKTESGEVGRCYWFHGDDEGPDEWWNPDNDQTAYPALYLAARSRAQKEIEGGN